MIFCNFLSACKRTAKKLTFLLLSLIFIASLFSCSPKKQNADASFYDNGYEAMIKGEYKTAIAFFKASIRKKEFVGESLYALSFCQMENKQYSRAANSAKKATALYEDVVLLDDKIRFCTDSLTQAGEAYLWQGKEKKALLQFERAADVQPFDYDVLTGIAAVFARTKNPSLAADFFEKRIRGTKNAAELSPLYYFYAAFLYALGDTDNAFSALQVAKENSVKAGISSYDEQIDDLFNRIAAQE